jgi:hypothetical protein
MRKRGVFIFLIVLSGLHLNAQQVSRKVLVPASSIASAGGFFISQTVGEPMIELTGDESYTLTQGFQQPSASILIDQVRVGNGVKVYPNPVRDNLTLELFGEQSLDYHVMIFGFNGAIYYRNDYPCVGKFKHTITLDVSRYQRGTYFVKVVTSDGMISRLFKIEKI